MTSVPFEALALAPRLTGISRGAPAAGTDAGGAFAALIESEVRGESALIAEAMQMLQSGVVAPPAAPAAGLMAEAATETESKSAESAPADVLAGLLQDLPTPEEGGPAPELTANPDAAAAVVAPVVAPTPPATAPAVSSAADSADAPAIPPAMPAQAAPEAPATPALDEATSPAAAAPQSAEAPTPIDKGAPAQEGKIESAQAGAIAAQARRADASAASDKQNEAQWTDAEDGASPSEADDAADQKVTKELPAQAAPVRPDATTGRSNARPDFIVQADEPGPQKPGADSTAQQLPAPSPMHAASTQAVTPQAAPVSAAQPVPVNALAIEIAAQARAGNSRFEIRLDPPELGRIDVRLDVDREGNVTSRLVIERADTYDLLRRDQSTLERALQQAGLKTSDNSLEFSLRDHGFAQRQDTDETPRGTQAVIHDAELPAADVASGYARLIGGRSGIDIRV